MSRDPADAVDKEYEVEISYTVTKILKVTAETAFDMESHIRDHVDWNDHGTGEETHHEDLCVISVVDLAESARESYLENQMDEERHAR